MRLDQLTVSAAALLLSATASFAQQGTAANNENVFIDVDGTPIQVPVALAAEACNLDEAGVQQAALSRAESSGLDDATVQELLAATTSDGTMASAGGTETAAVDPTSTPAPGSEPASAVNSDASAANAPAPGGGSVSTDMAWSDNAASDDMAGVLDNAETTAADATIIPNGDTTAAQGLDSEADEQRLALAVCQVEATRAGELGLSGLDGTTTGTDTTTGSGG